VSAAPILESHSYRRYFGNGFGKEKITVYPRPKEKKETVWKEPRWHVGGVG